MTLEEVTRYLAQGAINITEGCTIIEPGSKVHQAMQEWCRLVESGLVGTLITSTGKLPDEPIAAVNRSPNPKR